MALCLTANSSSPQIRASGADCLTRRAVMGGWSFGFPSVFVDAVEHFTHVLDLLEQGIGDVDGAFLSGGQGQAIAGAGINFDDLAGQLVLLLEDQPGEVGGVLEFGDNDALDGNAEAFENALHEIVREGPFFGCVVQKHTDDGAHVRLDVDDKNLLLITDKKGTAAVGGEDSPDLNRHHIVLHNNTLLLNPKKTSPASAPALPQVWLNSSSAGGRPKVVSAARPTARFRGQVPSLV
ncbi:hypothetical protein SBV1_1910014 [Verrucomicrobia bacterium]|nr:hypothetical protein SBV1_1910014 [Verrucomicrobiota bacterium]